jgi:hypothetical protein
LRMSGRKGSLFRPPNQRDFKHIFLNEILQHIPEHFTCFNR